MSIDFKEKERTRTFQDKFIAGFKSFSYALVEPLKLRLVRAKYSHLYQKKDSLPLVSVYTPTYNRGEILVERALKSVLKQTYTNFEYIIIGDHCTDNTEELVAKINDTRIRFYNLPARKERYPENVKNHWLAGPVIPANKALEYVKGKWIARLDDDEIWTPDHIESLLRFAQEGGYEFVTGMIVQERYGKRKTHTGHRALDPYFTGRKPPPEGVYNPIIGGTSTWFYRSYLRVMKYNIHCWRKSMNRVNDIDLVIRMFKAGVYMGFLYKVVGYQLPRPGEETVGWDAYNRSHENKSEHFKF